MQPVAIPFDVEKPVRYIDGHFAVVAAAQNDVPRALRKPQLVRVGVHERPAMARVVDGEVFRLVNHGAAQRPRALFLQFSGVAEEQGEGVGIRFGHGEICETLLGVTTGYAVVRQQAVIGKVIFVQGFSSFYPFCSVTSLMPVSVKRSNRSQIRSAAVVPYRAARSISHHFSRKKATGQR